MPQVALLKDIQKSISVLNPTPVLFGQKHLVKTHRVTHSSERHIIVKFVTNHSLTVQVFVYIIKYILVKQLIAKFVVRNLQHSVLTIIIHLSIKVISK